MAIPIKAEVSCLDGVCGKSTCVILDATSKQVTHVVVQDNSDEPTERLVPINQVVEVTPRQIQLRCTRAEFATMSTLSHSNGPPSPTSSTKPSQ